MWPNKGTRVKPETVSVLFLIVSAVAVFYTVLLIECSRRQHVAKKVSASLDTYRRVRLRSGRRLAIRLKKEMAFGSQHMV